MLLWACASYEYHIVEPAAVAGPVGEQPRLIEMQPLEYRFEQTCGYLGILAYNHTSEPVTLMGDQSYLVDPSGETHSLSGGTIAPNSHVTVYLPPQFSHPAMQPRYGIGIGMSLTLAYTCTTTGHRHCQHIAPYMLVRFLHQVR